MVDNRKIVIRLALLYGMMCWDSAHSERGRCWQTVFVMAGDLPRADTTRAHFVPSL